MFEIRQIGPNKTVLNEGDLLFTATAGELFVSKANPKTDKILQNSVHWKQSENFRNVYSYTPKNATSKRWISFLRLNIKDATNTNDLVVYLGSFEYETDAASAYIYAFRIATRGFEELIQACPIETKITSLMSAATSAYSSYVAIQQSATAILNDVAQELEDLFKEDEQAPEILASTHRKKAKLQRQN